MRDLSTLIAFVINFLIIFSYSAKRDDSEPENGAYGIQVVTTIYGIDFQIIITVLGNI